MAIGHVVVRERERENDGNEEEEGVFVFKLSVIITNGVFVGNKLMKQFVSLITYY